MSVQRIEWSTSADHVAPSSLTVTLHNGARQGYVRTGDAGERALKAGQDGYRLAQERGAEQLRDVVAIARSLKQCTTFAQVHDLAEMLIVRYGPPSEIPSSDEPQVTP